MTALALTEAEALELAAATPGPSWWSAAIAVLFVLGLLAAIAAAMEVHRAE